MESLFVNISGVQLAGIASSLSETKDAIEGLVRFIDTFAGALTTIADMIGFKAILLFLAILVISGGLSFFGIPRGKTSFFTSLAIADLTWIAFERSLSPQSYGFLITMLHTNVIVLIPFLAIFILKKIAPFIFMKTFSWTLSFIRIPFIQKRIIDNNEIIPKSERYHELSSQFQKLLFKDILLNRRIKNDKVILSSATIKFKKELEELLKEFQ